jgi:hypothetical protein
MGCLSAGAASARADHGPAQVPGYDISWPQCGKQYPAGPVAFAVIGITNGRPYTQSPCFLDQYRWAQHVERDPDVYVVLDYPKAGRPEAADGPYGRCAAADDWCRAYNYGYGIGRDVTARAVRMGITPSTWWLDVETASYWSNDPTYNAQVIRGTIDFFRERKLPLGIYGTPRQWRIIAGPYAPGLPIWTAGAQGVDEAARRCTDPAYAFAGGVVKMSQYYDYGFDTNYRCPGGHPLGQFPLPDPFGRAGPAGRSLSPAGAPLPHWRIVAMVTD